MAQSYNTSLSCFLTGQRPVWMDGEEPAEVSTGAGYQCRSQVACRLSLCRCLLTPRIARWLIHSSKEHGGGGQSHLYIFMFRFSFKGQVRKEERAHLPQSLIVNNKVNREIYGFFCVSSQNMNQNRRSLLVANTSHTPWTRVASCIISAPPTWWRKMNVPDTES